MVDELLTNGGLQNNFVLRDFLEGLENFLFTLGEEIKMLHRALIEHDVAPNLFVVTAFLVQQRFEIAIFANEIAFGQPGLVVVGRIGLNAGRHLPENRGTGRGGGDGRHGGVAIFRPLVAGAIVENGGAAVGFGQFERGFLGLFLKLAENLCGE